MNRKSRETITQIGVFVIWATTIMIGWWRLAVYSATPGVPAGALPEWPQTSMLSLDTRLPTLLIFAHPKCPCSEASLNELSHLIPFLKDKMRVNVVFNEPYSKNKDWVIKSRLWRKAQKIAGAHLTIDENGVEARNFKIHTSGQVLLFNQFGNLIFSGGITPKRGHEGNSPGRQAILTFLQSGHTSITHSPTFGCSLDTPERAPKGAFL